MRFRHLIKVLLRQWCCGVADGSEHSESKPPDETPSRQSAENKTPISLAEQQADKPFPNLELSVLQSTHLTTNTVLQIRPEGLEGTTRGDGTVLFGPDKADANDCVIEEYNESEYATHFKVHFSTASQRYYLSDMGYGSGTFVKVTAAVPLKESNIVSFGDHHVIAQLDEGKLSLNFIEGPKKGERYMFSDDEHVVVGRLADCQVNCEDPNLSRHQCRFWHSAERGWELADGSEAKGSLNGTWVFADENYEVTEGMFFRAGQNLFQAHLAVRE